MVKIGKINKNFPKNSAGKSSDINKYAASLAIATLIFIVGLLVGTYFINQKIAAINNMEDAMKIKLSSIELQAMFLQQEPCSSISVFQGELEDIESKIKFMESQLGKKDSQVLELKKYYSLLELKHYLLMNERKEKCNGNYSIILFFYSNAEENLLDGEKQGYVLDNIREIYGTGKVKTYSLDVDLDLDIVKTFTQFYNVTTVPTLIINDQIYAGFTSKDKLIADLGLSKSVEKPVVYNVDSINSTKNATTPDSSEGVIVLN